MIELSLNDYAAIATIAGAVGTSVVFIIKKFRRRSKTDKSTAESIINHEGTQIVTKEGANLTINGGVNNNINQMTKKVPDALAKPSINIRQIGFSNGGYPHKTNYTLQATNMGGNFFSLQVFFLNKLIVSVSTLARGRSVNLTLNLNDRPEYIELVFKGLNENGEEVHMSLKGTLVGSTRSEYEFSGF
ncbi:TPA: hypothetical protein ACX6S4_001628 [Photobacterium damselae]